MMYKGPLLFLFITNLFNIFEFIITFPKSNIDYLIIIECKASIEKHLSKLLNKPNEYAVDGVIHYGKYLSKEFDVIAIAVSGQNKKELLVSQFIFENI